VTKASRYEPLLNRTYEDLSAHFGSAVITNRTMSKYESSTRRRTLRRTSGIAQLTRSGISEAI
jgi:hypothetical protein